MKKQADLNALRNVASDAALHLLADQLPTPCAKTMHKAEQRQNELTKPQGALGRLEKLAIKIAGLQETELPRAENAHTIIFAGNHGITAQGVSAYPADVTAQMVANYECGGAAINQLCEVIPSNLNIIPLALDRPTGDFTTGPAMSDTECIDAFQTGVDAVPEDADILVLGEMGIGNTTPAAALSCYACGGTANEWTGRGTGIIDSVMEQKIELIDQAIALHRDSITGPLSLLARLGGRELAAICGAVAAARILRIPITLDGYVVTAAAATLTLHSKEWLSHCIAGHCSVEPGHVRLLKHLQLSPLLNLEMRLGEGTGAQLALAIVRAALATHNGMATFSEMGVSRKAS